MATGLLAVAFAAAACSTPGGAPGTTTTAPPETVTRVGHASLTTALTWHPCHKRFECARLVVPLDYSRPGAGTISLAVIELPATDEGSTRDLVTNPGGPGGSGVSFLESSSGAFPADLRARFNLISFDPRGVGGSAPVHCSTLTTLRAMLALDPAPTTAAEVRTVIAGVKDFVRACERGTSRAVLDNVSTAATARDMDRLRAALGQQHLDYLGFSYGTYLGTLYAEMFGRRVGDFVLDGAVDPALGTVATETEQAAGFQADLDDFFSWCAGNTACTGELGSDPAASYERLVGGLEAGRTITAHLPASEGGTQPVDYGTAAFGIAGALYSPESRPYLAAALAHGLEGDGSDLAELALSFAGVNANGTIENELDAETAIGCVDRPSPTSLGTIERLAGTLGRASPDFGAIEAWGSLTCRYWPVRPQGRVGPAHLARPLPILVVGSTHDPATPYRWARALASQLQGSRLLTRDGDGHTGYFNSACVRGDVDRYLLTGVLPAEGTVCSS